MKQVVTRTTTKRNLFQSQSVLESTKKSSRHMQVQSQVLTKNVIKEQNSDDSENDIFRETPKKWPKSANSAKPHSKILSQMAYITQKMIPEFQRSIQYISQAEDKALDFHVEQVEQPTKNQNQQLNFGEVLINYQHDKHPIELRPEMWNVQSVRQMEFYYYKIRAKMQPAPLQFYMNQSEATNFKIFVSSVNPFPTKFSCDQIVSAKGWKYKMDESKIFHSEYIYLSMVSDLDTQVKLKYQFGNKLLKRPPTISKKPELLFVKASLERMNSDVLLAQVAEIKKRRKEKLRQRGMFKDLIKENIQKVIEYNEEQQRSFRELKRTQYDNRIEDVLERKKLMSQNEQQRKEYQQKTKELSKIIRQRHNFVEQRRNLKNRVCAHWFSFVLMANLCTKAYYMFQHKIEAHNQSTLMAFQVKRIMKRIHKRLSMIKGVTLYDRVFFDAKLMLQCFCKAVKPKQVKIHVEKIIPHLKQRAELYYLRNQILNCHGKIQKIRQVFTEFLLRYKNYKQMLHNIWMKYFKEQFLKYYNQLDQLKKETYQPFIIQLQNSETFNQLQQIFIEGYSIEKLRKYLKEMSDYSKYIKKLRSQKYNKTKRKEINEQIMHQPRLFQIPTFDDVLEQLPQINYSSEQRMSQQITQSQVQVVQEIIEKKKKGRNKK